MSIKENNNRNNLKKVAYAGVLAALVFIGTELHIPTAIGHINLGDLVILVSSYILGPLAFFPAAIGSTLADLLAGYPQYAVATFIIICISPAKSANAPSASKMLKFRIFTFPMVLK